MATTGTSKITLESTAAFMRLLGAHGVTEDAIRRATRQPGRISEVASVIQTDAPKLPANLPTKARQELIDVLFPAKIDAEGRKKAKVQYALYQDEREWLATQECVAMLLLQLTAAQLRIVVRRSGLDGRRILTTGDLADQLGLTTSQVNKRRTNANRVMRDKAIVMVNKCRQVRRLAL